MVVILEDPQNPALAEQDLVFVDVCDENAADELTLRRKIELLPELLSSKGL